MTCIAIPLAFAPIVFWSEIFTGQDTWKNLKDFVQLSYLIGGPISLVAMYLFAMPMLVFFRGRGLLGFLQVCGLTTLIGALILPASLSFMFGGGLDGDTVAIGAGTGAVAGIAFCLLAGVPWRPRPS